jgi:hypothetical protein
MLMKLGRATCIQQDLVGLFPECRELHAFMCEYLILILTFCRRIVAISNKSAVLQWTSTVSSSLTSEFKSVETNLGIWSTLIEQLVNRLNTEMNLGTGRAVERANHVLSRWISKEHRQKKGASVRTKKRILDLLCPEQREFEHNWRHERRKGNTNWILRTQEFGSWRDSTQSSVLWVTGSLGSGKTVLMANLVDHLSVHVAGRLVPMVAYFFCRYKKDPTLKPRTIFGSLIHQLIKNFDTGTDQDLAAALQQTSLDELDTEDPIAVLDWALEIIPRNRSYFLVLDSLEDCSPPDMDAIFAGLLRLSKDRRVHICCSTRHAKKLSPVVDIANSYFQKSTAIPMKASDNDAELKAFIDREIEARQNFQPMDAGIVEALKKALFLGAQGM